MDNRRAELKIKQTVSEYLFRRFSMPGRKPRTTASSSINGLSFGHRMAEYSNYLLHWEWFYVIAFYLRSKICISLFLYIPHFKSCAHVECPPRALSFNTVVLYNLIQCTGLVFNFIEVSDGIEATGNWFHAERSISFVNKNKRRVKKRLTDIDIIESILLGKDTR